MRFFMGDFVRIAYARHGANPRGPSQTGRIPVRLRSRTPRATPLYQLPDQHHETVRGLWDERFERRYGFWSGYGDTAVAGYLDCGPFESSLRSSSLGRAGRSYAEAAGCARVVCPKCRSESPIVRRKTGGYFSPSCSSEKFSPRSLMLRPYFGFGASPSGTPASPRLHHLPRRRLTDLGPP